MAQTQTSPKTTQTATARASQMTARTKTQQNYLARIQQIHAEMCASQVSDPKGDFGALMRARAPITGIYSRGYKLAMRSTTLTLDKAQLQDIIILQKSLTDARLVLVGNPTAERSAEQVRAQLLKVWERVRKYSDEQQGLRNELLNIILDGGKLVRAHIDAQTSAKEAPKSTRKAKGVEQAIRDEDPDASWEFAAEEIDGAMPADEH